MINQEYLPCNRQIHIKIYTSKRGKPAADKDTMLNGWPFIMILLFVMSRA